MDNNTTNTGVSKKFCAFMVSVQAVGQMSAKVEDPWKYACLIAGMFVTYKVAQIFKDIWMKPKAKSRI
jgi:hypothetical protein